MSDRDGPPDLYISQVGPGHFLNPTRDPEIWFVQADGMVHMPLTGGNPRPFLAPGAAGPARSP
jgi:hypothetical protein